MPSNDWKWDVGRTVLLAMGLDLFALYCLFQVATTGVLPLRTRNIETIAEGSLAWVLSLAIVFLGVLCSYRAYQLWGSRPDSKT